MREKKITRPSILIIYTGGTIGMIRDNETGFLKAFNFNQIQDNISEIQQLNCRLETVSFDVPIDSSNMSIAHYCKLADLIYNNYEKFDGFVVLSGTDTMSYTASMLSFMLHNLCKPVVFTGSQLPIGDLRTDAKENLITSIEIASIQKDNKPLLKEVALYFEYKLFRANRTTKISTDQFEAFASRNYPILAESGVRLNFNLKALLRLENNNDILELNKDLIPNVTILKLFPGITDEVVESILNTPNLKGVILETYGSGNAPTNPKFIRQIKNTIEKGVYIVNVSQCAEGSVLMGEYETSLALKEIGVINGKDITTESAIAKMMYLLGLNLDKDKFKDFFEISLRGEIG